MKVTRALAEVFNIVSFRLVGREDEECAMIEALRGLVEVERGDAPFGIVDRVLVLAIEAVRALK
jgi:hypothetical protein